MVNQYEATVKKLIPEYIKHDLKYPFSAYSTNEFDYYFLIPIDNFADMDNVNKAFSEVREKMGAKKYDAIWSEFGGTVKYDKNGFYTFRADLSYIPEKPRLKPEDVNFIFWLNYYYKTDKMPEVEKVYKEWISFFKSKNIDTGFYAYEGGIGSEMPYISVSLGDRNAEEFFAQSAKRDKMYADKFAELWKKSYALLRKFEQKMGQPRPDLSYTPKAE